MDKELQAKLVDHYQKGQGSIQDLARIYKVSVDEVLDAIGLGNDTPILTGDLIDQSEAGPEATVNSSGTPVKQTYSVD